MHKNIKKSFENERKIERCYFATKREREHKTDKKLCASDAQNFRLSASASNFIERTKALVIHITRNSDFSRKSYFLAADGSSHYSEVLL